MPERHWIEALPPLAGQTVTVRGWVTTTRSSGKIAFVVVRDGTGLMQAVLSKRDLGSGVWDSFEKLTQETSVEVTGVVRLEPRAPGGVEMQTADLRILGLSPDFPITPKEHGTAFLFEHRHLWLRSKQQVAIARVRHEVIQAIRDFFHQRHFTLVDTPILTGSIGEHAGTLFSVDYLDRKSTRLNSSHANISYAVFCLKKKKTTTSRPSSVTTEIRLTREEACHLPALEGWPCRLV